MLGRPLVYGDGHASHSSFPHLEKSDLFCLTSRLGPDVILAALSCLLQVSYCCVLVGYYFIVCLGWLFGCLVGWLVGWLVLLVGLVVLFDG